jgi:3-hydroxy-9,10-secoandrosta-1,3,5(10)-triene-9,17-dione monooxygenase reductase component
MILDRVTNHAHACAQRGLLDHPHSVPRLSTWRRAEVQSTVMSIDPLKYRLVLGHFPTGVTVVTAIVDDEPVGFTIGSFTSVSLDPPLVGFLPMTTSDRWIRMADANSFCVNVLGIDHGDLCWRFAKSSIENPFEGVSWSPSPVTGSPILDGAIAWMDCTTAEVVDAGDHYFVMGLVVAMDHADEDSKPAPLLFFRGQLGGFVGQG